MGTGYPIIVSGWTNPKTLQLEPSEYAALGSLRNISRGFRYLYRNLLANPDYRHVILLCATRFDKNARIEPDIESFLNGENIIGIDPKHQDYLRQYWVFIICHDFRELRSALELVKVSREVVEPLPALEPIYLMDSELEKPMNRFQGRYIGNLIDGETIAECWQKLIKAVRANGIYRKTHHGIDWQECLDIETVIRGELGDYELAAENGVTLDDIHRYRGLLLDAQPTEGTKYTYGTRLRTHFGVDQLQQVIDKLRDDPTAASAVCSLWDVNDHVKGGSPCLNHLWFRLTETGLTLTATFRSHDLFGAWLLNAYGLRELQREVAAAIGEPVAELIIYSQSAHIYADCWEYIDRMDTKSVQRYDDPCGYFLIEWREGIQVTQISKNQSRIYRGTAKKIFQQIEADNPHISTSHALYLGYEINECFKTQNQYIQS